MARYSKAVVERAKSRRGYVNGWYHIRCTNAKKQEPHEESGNLRSDLTFAPLRKDGTEGKPGIRHFMTYPLENPNIAGHEAPQTEGMTIPIVQALFPKECPLYPRTDTKTKKLMYKGKAIEKDNIETCREEAATTCLDKLDKLEMDPEPFVGKECYAKVFYQDGSDFPKLGTFMAELPAGAVLVDEKEWFGMVKSASKAAAPALGKTKGKSSGGSGGAKKKSRFGR
jgi:hypothetical protein